MAERASEPLSGAPRTAALFGISLVPALLAVLIYLPALSGGFLSDDFLLNFLLDHEAQRPHVRWDEVFRDFGRPWAGIEGLGLYRPLVTLSYAIDFSLGGGHAFPFHLTNLIGHAIASGLCAVLCGLYCPRRFRTAALLGGAVFALHPVGAEPAVWISGRVSTLEVVLRLGCLTAFAFHLRTRRTPSLVLSFVLALAALGAKESAVILPVSLLALDLLYVWPPVWRAVLRRQLLFLPLWFFYAAVRWLALGTFFGASLGEGTRSPLESFLANLPGKCRALFAPGSCPPSWLIAVPLFLLLVYALLTRSRRILLGGCLLWILCHFVTSFPLYVDPHLGGSRVVYGAVAVLALMLCLVAFADARGAAERERGFVLPYWTGILSLLLLLAGHGWLSRTRLGDYEKGWHEITALHEELDRLATTASAESPVAIVNTPSDSLGVPLVRADAVYPLAERPFAPSDHPVLGMNFVTQRILDSSDLFLDVSPLRAMQGFGASLVYWERDDEAFRIEIVANRGKALPPLRLEKPTEGQGYKRRRFHFAGPPVSPYRIDALELRISGKAEGVILRWSGPADAPAEWTQHLFGRGRAHDGETVFRIDLSHSATFLAHHPFGGIQSFEVELSRAEEGARIGSLSAIAQLPELALSRRLRGAELELTEAQLGILAPSLPDTELELRLILLGPHAGHSVPVAQGQGIRLPPRLLAKLRGVMRVSRQKRIYYYFEALSPSGTSLGGARSEVDWFTVTPDSR